MKKIKFGYIAPLEYLNKIPDSATFHLCLAHLTKYPEYNAFYKAKSERGDYIIMDNSAFELGEGIGINELIEMIDMSGINPTIVVAPDYPNQPWQKTWESTLNFMDATASKPYGIMAVPQSEEYDYRGWIEGYKRMLDHPGINIIGMSILAIPNAFKALTGVPDIGFNRLYATKYLLDGGIASSGEKWHHYLGQGDGPGEILIQRQLGLIDSNDSSSVFWCAINGIPFDFSASGLKGGKIKMDVDFTVPYTSIVEEMLSWNIDYFENVILG